MIFSELVQSWFVQPKFCNKISLKDQYFAVNLFLIQIFTLALSWFVSRVSNKVSIIEGPTKLWKIPGCPISLTFTTFSTAFRQEKKASFSFSLSLSQSSLDNLKQILRIWFSFSLPLQYRDEINSRLNRFNESISLDKFLPYLQNFDNDKIDESFSQKLLFAMQKQFKTKRKKIYLSIYRSRIPNQRKRGRKKETNPQKEGRGKEKIVLRKSRFIPFPWNTDARAST